MSSPAVLGHVGVGPALALGSVVAAGALWVVATGRGRASGAASAAFAAALAALALALVGPVEAAAHERLSAHMVQHLLLTVVAAPLLVLARPHRVVARALPLGARRRWGRWERRAGGLRPRRRWLAWQAGAAALYAAVLWAWHAPALHEASLASWPLHALQHLTLLLAALVLWGVVIGGARSGAEAGSVLALFLASLAGMAVAALITFAPSPWYPAYGEGADALADQQVAGAVMWMPGKSVLLVAAGALTVRWLGAGHPARRRRVGPGQATVAPAGPAAGGAPPRCGAPPVTRLRVVRRAPGG